ncbi:MAG: hypothetical protein LBM77_13785 [Spirochaetaceae bacterium]|jgi:hypothetical protein|nr:hypothetical protein [Spirochaetaceae bacterium]
MNSNTKGQKGGLNTTEVLFIGVLLAAGAVLKFFVGSVINFGMKPNFIIAMYCLCILLIRPGFVKAGIIGLLAGAICQFFPGQPFLNFASELIGAVVMCLFTMLIARAPANKALETGFNFAATFLSTLASGFSFVGIMYLLYYSGFDISPTPLAIFLGIIFGTATINSVIVSILYIPLKAVLPRQLRPSLTEAQRAQS